MSSDCHSLVNRLILTLLLSLNWSLMANAQDDELVDDASQIPHRPYGHILDVARWLTLEEKGATQRELTRLFDENKIDVYLVTLPKQPPQGAQTYSRKLGEAWSRAPVWCVVFHVPGDPSGFHVEAGGVEIDRQEIEKAIAEASKRARREGSEKERVMAAWKECSEGLRFLHASGQRYNERVVKVKKEMRTDIVEGKLQKKIIIAAAGGGAVLLALFLYFLIRMIRKRRFKFEFPETSWRTRFQGPHSGGSGIVVNFRSKRLK